MEQYKPKHDIALVSLCTSTRPYSKSRKWKKFIQLYGNDADLIICSNGGIIPIEFENCYPYLTYDAHGQGKYDRVYVEVCYKRLMKFFSKFHYKRIVFNFRPRMRNRICARAFKQNYKEYDTEIYILPTEETYKKVQASGFPSGKMFPDLDANVLFEITNAIRKEQKNEER